MHCSHCNAYVMLSANFCSGCGKKVIKDETQGWYLGSFWPTFLAEAQIVNYFGHTIALLTSARHCLYLVEKCQWTPLLVRTFIA